MLFFYVHLVMHRVWACHGWKKRREWWSKKNSSYLAMRLYITSFLSSCLTCFESSIFHNFFFIFCCSQPSFGIILVEQHLHLISPANPVCLYSPTNPISKIYKKLLFVSSQGFCRAFFFLRCSALTSKRIMCCFFFHMDHSIAFLFATFILM